MVKAWVVAGQGPADVATKVTFWFLQLLNQPVVKMASRTSAGQLVFDLTNVTPGPWERGFLVAVTITHSMWKEMGNEILKNLSLEIAPDFLLALNQVGLGLLEHSLNLSSSGDVL